MFKNAIDTMMERLVVPSFSRIGVRVRKRLFKWAPLDSYNFQSKVVVLTGGTSGIGKEAAFLYANLGATLVLIGRNPDKTQQNVNDLKKETNNNDIHSIIGDLGNHQDVLLIADQLATKFPNIHVLVHNAGALFNNRQRADNGTDLSVELMVATPFLLTGLLLEQLKASNRIKHNPQAADNDSTTEPGRVLTMSSGGMYTEPLSVSALEMSDENYQGAQQYARAKRAQVVLNELWADTIAPEEIVFHSLHPGWAKTPGITEALPGFSKILNPLGLLRTPREGSDTMIWLSAAEQAVTCSGQFWHDRAIRDIHMSAKSRQANTPERRHRLWQWCEAHTGWQLPTS